jgi:hypothetical protein
MEAVRRRIDARAGLHQSIAPEPRAFRGYVDLVRPELISGWAQNPEHPEAPVCLDIFVGDRLIGRALANRYREDLARAGLGSGRHSFEFTPPAGLAFTPHTLKVRRSFDGASLDWSVNANRAA